MNTLWEALSGHLEEADELNEKVTAKLSAARGRLSSAVRRKSVAARASRASRESKEAIEASFNSAAVTVPEPSASSALNA